MDKKILNCVQAKPKNVSLIEPNKKVKAWLCFKI